MASFDNVTGLVTISTRVDMEASYGWYLNIILSGYMRETNLVANLINYCWHIIKCGKKLNSLFGGKNLVGAGGVDTWLHTQHLQGGCDWTNLFSDESL